MADVLTERLDEWPTPAAAFLLGASHDRDDPLRGYYGPEHDDPYWQFRARYAPDHRYLGTDLTLESGRVAELVDLLPHAWARYAHLREQVPADANASRRDEASSLTFYFGEVSGIGFLGPTTEDHVRYFPRAFVLTSIQEVAVALTVFDHCLRRGPGLAEAAALLDKA